MGSVTYPNPNERFVDQRIHILSKTRVYQVLTQKYRQIVNSQKIFDLKSAQLKFAHHSVTV